MNAKMFLRIARVQWFFQVIFISSIHQQFIRNYYKIYFIWFTWGISFPSLKISEFSLGCLSPTITKQNPRASNPPAGFDMLELEGNGHITAATWCCCQLKLRRVSPLSSFPCFKGMQALAETRKSLLLFRVLVVEIYKSERPDWDGFGLVEGRWGLDWLTGGPAEEQQGHLWMNSWCETRGCGWLAL